MQDDGCEKAPHGAGPGEGVISVMSAMHGFDDETAVFLSGFLHGYLFCQLWNMSPESLGVGRADLCMSIAAKAIYSHLEDIFPLRQIAAGSAAGNIRIESFVDTDRYLLAAEAAKDAMLAVISGDRQQ